ncbi:MULTISPECIES: signal peptide peptidase SppA [Psychrilyobacter]|nr:MULTISPECIES: signal peptide peptidase SppA [Psychrilyobacter]MCS5421623.1 signal peptide peptidase SppA [Psychrilyobacter sp. S5]NDI76682.1 signal peptide peptidase SppA [Psychrilyobacter piezotolerans]
MKMILKYIGKIILFFSKQVLQATLVVMIFLIIIAGVITATLTEYKKEIVIEKNTYLELDFSKGISEKDEGGFFELEKAIKLYQVLEGIKQASKEPNIEGIYMDIDHVDISVNHIEEVGEALDEFKKSGKKVYAFTRNIDNQNYRLGIYATKIVMPPIQSAMIDLSGYYREFNYFKNLADYVGIKFNVIHIGEYKAYGEQYSKGKMSKEFEKDVKRVYDRVYNDRIEEISKRRDIEKLTMNKAILGGELVMTNPIYGKKIGLIDGLSYQSEFDEKYEVGNKISLEDYLTTIKRIEKKEKLALIYASGDIVYKGPRGSENSINVENMKSELKKAEEDKDVKGIVLRVNSPGGSALASEIIHHEISKLSKPVYVSMGGVAASGGYYISAGAKKIFATKSTITGSIGVVSIIPEISGLVKKSMINVERVEKGRYSGMNSLTAEMTPGEIEKIRRSSLGVYDEFKNRVSLGRNIPLDKLESVAGGRIWLGEEGVENGLVDEIGGLETTIKTLGRDLKLKDYQVVEIMEKKGMYETVLGYRDIYSKVRSFVRTPMIEAARFRIKTPLLFMPYEFN